MPLSPCCSAWNRKRFLFLTIIISKFSTSLSKLRQDSKNTLFRSSQSQLVRCDSVQVFLLQLVLYLLRFR